MSLTWPGGKLAVPSTRFPDGGGARPSSRSAHADERVRLCRPDAEPPRLHRGGGSRCVRPPEDAVKPLLQISDLSVTFDVPGASVDAVRHVSFDVDEGE